MKIAISAESTIDITEEIKKANDIKIVPFQIFLGDDNKLDGEITSHEIIEFVNKNKILPKTGAVNSAQFEEHFSSIKKDYDAIIHFSLSSELSSAYNNAKSVADTMENVYVIDTRSLSTGIALLALYAVELVKKGLDAKDIYEKCLERVPFVQASFELMRLDYLYKGGRCSSLAYFGANLLRIRPQILVKDGKMVSGKKYRGNFEHVVNKYCEDVLAEFNSPDLSNVFITYTTASPEIIEGVKNRLIARGFKKIYVTTAGGTITSHCGENCLGILYINDGDRI
ncbi:MAG: DegV family protein [Clostridia bacterium]|nr:DegV family protein [Clostridia bacterium]MBQ9514316.1 DegV family protein [Clostridia bacterium]